MRMRRKANLENRIEKCVHMLIVQPETLRGKWLQVFKYEALHLEIGCGKGCFITETAKDFPNVLFIALEKTANVMVTALERTVREGIPNIRYINVLAENLRDYFAPGELSQIYINFCDPWPSNRHKKRRLVNSNFLSMYKELLCTNGKIHFKTDNLPLFEFSLNEFSDCRFSILESSLNIHENGPIGIMTEYEQRFYAMGQPIYLCKALKGE